MTWAFGVRGGRVSPLQFVMLVKLRERPMYGYELLKALREDFEGLWPLQTGTLYPSLKRLEEQDLVRSEQKDGVDYYSLTEKGNEAIADKARKMPGDLRLMIRYFEVLEKAAKEFPAETSKDAGTQEEMRRSFREMFERDTFSPQERLRILKQHRDALVARLAAIHREIEELENKQGKEDES